MFFLYTFCLYHRPSQNQWTHLPTSHDPASHITRATRKKHLRMGTPKPFYIHLQAFQTCPSSWRKNFPKSSSRQIPTVRGMAEPQSPRGKRKGECRSLNPPAASGRGNAGGSIPRRWRRRSPNPLFFIKFVGNKRTNYETWPHTIHTKTNSTGNTHICRSRNGRTRAHPVLLQQGQYNTGIYKSHSRR